MDISLECVRIIYQGKHWPIKPVDDTFKDAHHEDVVNNFKMLYSEP